MEALNSKYDDILRRGRMLTIPLIRWDDHVLNNVIKQEDIDENGHNYDDSILKIGNQNIIMEEFSMETSKPSMLLFPQVFKRENIDENGHNNDDSKSQIG
ncbi:unnamed protein product [Macrosiphum euphorbiae]|uniref:Uncharacterized protein n=1 Tax=Macrosiphum euphorbiae TaxID=13131 RepID=A0AAV0X2I9_9HEMI|nr:unnamed protein product [Macrosiphum euphorbiae]